MTVAIAGLPSQAFNEQPTNYGLTFMFRLTPTITPTTTFLPVVGSAVGVAQAVTYTPNGDGRYTGTVFVVNSAPSADYLVIGVCIGGSVAGTNPILGGVCMTRVLGVCQVLVNTKTIFGAPLVQSTTPGVLKYAVHTHTGTPTTPTAPPVGQIVAVALEALTSATPPKLCWAWVAKA